jgi:chaperonin cofactor prefoldin
MQEHLDRIDAILAQLVDATAALQVRVAEKEQRVATLTRQSKVLDAQAHDMQAKLPKMRETCEGLKDV